MLSVGKRIQNRRRELKMTQEQLAEAVEISVDYIGLIERGARSPKLETFIKIANVLKVSSDELLADYLECCKQNELTNKIDQLPEEDRQHIYEVIELLIKQTT